jgi:hypothetical protein
MDVERLVLESTLDRWRRDRDGFDCSREGDAHHVRLWGSLPPAWVGNLALQTSVLGITILSGDAARIGATRWVASLLLRAADPRARSGHDFLRMARRTPRFPPLLLEPVQITLEDGPDGSNVVFAHVTGKDTVGLRAESLRRFAMLSLQPRALSLRTIDGEVDDRFRLEPF